MSGLTAQELIEKYLSEARIMQLATVRDDQPWICSLHFAADDESNIYWITKPTARHSQEIADNPNVAIAIAFKTDRPLIGVQTEGTAEIVEDPDLLKSAMERYIERQGTDRAFADQIIAGTNEHKLYKFTPKLFSLFDQVNFSDQPSQEWVIDRQ